MTSKKFLFTSESVTEGHPDKVCDQNMINVMVDLIGSPVPLVKICGTSNNCNPPISDVITTYTKIGTVAATGTR